MVALELLRLAYFLSDFGYQHHGRDCQTGKREALTERTRAGLKRVRRAGKAVPKSRKGISTP